MCARVCCGFCGRSAGDSDIQQRAQYDVGRHQDEGAGQGTSFNVRRLSACLWAAEMGSTQTDVAVGPNRQCVVDKSSVHPRSGGRRRFGGAHRFGGP